MSTVPAADLTSLLAAWHQGQPGALNALMTRVYRPLRRIAANQLRQRSQARHLETAALINETFLRLVSQQDVDWRDRAHFFAIAARVMRRVLVDHHRRHAAIKRGGGTVFCHLGDRDITCGQPSIDVLAIDDALRALGAIRPELARLVELRFFGGLTKRELAAALDIAPATVTRRWRLARAWLHRFLEGETIDVG